MTPRATRFGLAAVAVCAGLQLATPSRADDGGAQSAAWRLGVGPLLGGLAFDPSLENYRWDVSPSLQAGAQASLFHGPFAAGARAWRTHTTQATGFPGDSHAPRVALTGVELVGQGRMLSYRGVELWGAVHGGRLFLAYDPDQLVVDTGIGSPITVAFASIAEWDYGFGIEIRGDLRPQLALALQAERTSFSLDTAHRSGDEIVASRERFDQWSLRVQASWLWGW